jgi:hypothetical protein
MNRDNFVPFECPVCLTLMRDAKDVFAFFASGCCYECKEEYLFPNGIKTVEEIEISKDIQSSLRKKRKKMPSYILR